VKRLLIAVCTGFCALGCAACDGSHTSSNSRSGTAPAGSTARGGPAVFVHSCASCHSLVGNESLHKQGGDLLGYHLTRAQLTSFTRVMPATLTPAQLRAVVDYVYRVQQTRGKGLLGLPGD
jgi:mono/diheme cytochrome c family protein